MTGEDRTILSDYPYFADGQFVLEKAQPSLVAKYLESIRENQEDFIKITPHVFIHAKMLKWDTAHFDIPMARIEHFYFTGEVLPNEYFDDMVAWFNLHKVRHISVRLSLQNKKAINFLMQAGFELITGKLMLQCNVAKHSELPNTEKKFSITQGITIGETENLMEIARGNFIENRFMSDRYLDTGKSEQVYDRWLHGEMDKNPEKIIVVKKDKELAGFSLADKLQVDQLVTTGFINLIAVKKQYQGMGIGRILLNGTLERFKQQGLTQVYANVVSTNYSSLSLFQSCGFRIFSTLLELRKYISQ